MLTACQSLQQHCSAPRTEGPAASDPALFHTGLSKHQGFVSYLSLRNKPAESPVPDGSPVIFPMWHRTLPESQKTPWEHTRQTQGKFCLFLLPPVACSLTCKASGEMGTQVSFLPPPCSLGGFTKPCLSDPCGGTGDLPVGSDSCTGWPRIECVPWHVWLPQEGCLSLYGASRYGHSSE